MTKQATGERLVFDLKSDIGQARNLLDQHPDRADQLDAELVAWEKTNGWQMKKTRATFEGGTPHQG